MTLAPKKLIFQSSSSSSSSSSFASVGLLEKKTETEADPNPKIDDEPLLDEHEEKEGGGESPKSSQETSAAAAAAFDLPNKLTRDIQEKRYSYGQIFKDDDVIVLLQGLIDFKSKNMTDFYFFIKDKLSNQFTKKQITEKFRRLRKKFVGNLKKTTQGQNIIGDFDSIVFHLSNKLWGDDEEKATTRRPRKRKHIDRELKGIMIKEIELYCNKLELMKEMIGLVAQSLKGL